MKFNLLLFLFFSMTNLSMSKSFFHHQLSPLLNKNLNSETETSKQCVNFTGKWKGKCTYDGGEGNEHTYNFYQKDCKAIYILKSEEDWPNAQVEDVLYIGIMRNETITFPETISSFSESSYWSANGEVLQIPTTGMAKQNADPFSVAGSYEYLQTLRFKDSKTIQLIFSKHNRHLASCTYNQY